MWKGEAESKPRRSAHAEKHDHFYSPALAANPFCSVSSKTRTWCGYGLVWYGMVWYGHLCRYTLWYGIWYFLVGFGMIWYGMGFGIVWYGKVWYGMVWCGMV